MKLIRTPLGTLASLMLLLGLMTPAGAGMWDDPKNLEVLPEDISPEELRATMRGFAGNTGSRCSACHVGKVESDLSTYDFSLDDKEKKLKARHMIRMVADINGYLEEKLGNPAAELVAVDCATCHRGQEKPEMLHDVLERTYREAGMDGAIAEYRQLRDRYYGDYAFDFSPRSLMILAENLASMEDYEAALGFLDLNMEFNPDSVRTLQYKARFQQDIGDKVAARESLLKAIELEPENQWTRQLLERLDNS